MARIFACIELTPAAILKAKKSGCSKVVFVKSSSGESPAAEGSIELINANQYERIAYRDSFFRNKKMLEEFQRRAPEFFVYRNIPLLEAINKDLFWKRRYEGVLQYAVLLIKSMNDEILYERQPFLLLKKLAKTFLIATKFIYGLFSIKSRNIDLTKELKGKKYAFYIQNGFGCHYSETLVEAMGKEECVFISNSVARLALPKKYAGVDIISMQDRDSPAAFSLNSLLSGVAIFGVEDFLLLLSIRRDIMRGISGNCSIFNSDIQAVFLIAQENTGFGNVTAFMGKQYGKLIVNSHNGLKSTDPYNRDNHFDVWCCWDQRMKEFLCRDCGIDGHQLVVTGHVMEDRARNYISKNTFSDFYNLASGNQVISLFSINDTPPNKWEAIHAVIEFAQKRRNMQLLIRLHPSEDRKEWERIAQFLDASRIRLVFPEENESKDRLYDQLAISDAAVVFGSTVALECSWFNVPCITFEDGEKSLLYFVDGKNTIHARTLDSLLGKLNEILGAGEENTIERRTGHPWQGSTPGVQNLSVAQKIKNLVTDRLENSVNPGKTHDLLLFTSIYPYGSDEVFAENELKITARYFRKVFVYPACDDRTIRPMPANAVCLSFPAIRPARWLTLLANFVLLAKVMGQELRVAGLNRFIKYFRSNLSSLMHALHLAEYISHDVRRHGSSEKILYSYWMNSWALALAILKYKRKIKGFIFRVHGYDLYDHLRPDSYIPFRYFNMEMCARVFTACEAAQSYLASRKIFPEKIQTAQLGVFDNGQNPFDPSAFTIVSCSSLNKYKRVDKIVEVLRQVGLKITWIHFGGKGDWISLEEFKGLCEKLPPNISWQLRGQVANEALMQFYKTTPVNLFVHLTYSEGGVPVALQEAASFGIPLLGANAGGVAEIVNDNTGILVEKDFQVADVADKIRAFACGRRNTVQFRQEVKTFWREHFEAERNFTSLLTWIDPSLTES